MCSSDLASRDEASLRARVEADFLTGDEGSACAEVSAPDRLASFRGEFWNRATTVCDAVGGRTAQAQLALDLMGEQGVPADSPFAVLLRSALGDRATLTNLSGVGAVELPLLRLSKAEVAATALPSASVLALRTIALGKGALPIRLEAAERAEALGGISTANLAEIYASVPFKNDEKIGRAHV